MPRKNKTDVSVVCFMSKDKHFIILDLQLEIEKQSGVRPLLEDLVSEAFDKGLPELCKEHGITYNIK